MANAIVADGTFARHPVILAPAREVFPASLPTLDLTPSEPAPCRLRDAIEAEIRRQLFDLAGMTNAEALVELTFGPAPAEPSDLDEIAELDRLWWAEKEGVREDRELMLESIFRAELEAEIFDRDSGQAYPDCEPDELIAAIGERAYQALLAEERGMAC